MFPIRTIHKHPISLERRPGERIRLVRNRWLDRLLYGRLVKSGGVVVEFDSWDEAREYALGTKLTTIREFR